MGLHKFVFELFDPGSGRRAVALGEPPRGLLELVVQARELLDQVVAAEEQGLRDGGAVVIRMGLIIADCSHAPQSYADS